MLPLGYWDSLYYALVAEIRHLHAELTRKYGFACQIANPVLHEQGPDGTTNQPITAVDLTSLLETAWYALMDNRLVAALDNAVLMKNLRAESEKEEVDSAVQQYLRGVNKWRLEHLDYDPKPESIYWPPPIIEGLIDMNAFTPEAIVSLLWEKHAPAINRACLEDAEDETLLTAYRAEQRAKEVQAAVAASTPLPDASFCACHRSCVCKMKCDQNEDHCTCLSGRAQVYHLVHKQESQKQALHAQYVKPDENVPNMFLGAASNTLAQMQIAAIANPEPVIVRAIHDIHEADNARNFHVARSTRQRSNTTNSDLAYVPQTHNTPRPGLRPKDVYPLAFYGSRSPQRYPRMPATTSSPYGNLSSTSAGTGLHRNDVPPRKPVPPPINTSGNPYGWNAATVAQDSEALTPPMSSPLDTQTFHATDQVTYPTIPRSGSDGLFTQSFPAKSGNPRDVRRQHAGPSHATAPDPNDPANAYIGLLSRHPSTIESGAHFRDDSWPLTHATISGPPKQTPTIHSLPTLATLHHTISNPNPALPEPDFIAPRPALKQRYVSAGGTAKLSERVEIAAPPFTAPVTLPGGPTISKDELDAKMNDPEWMKLHFGEHHPAITPPRRSVESALMFSGRISGRKSGESELITKNDKRQRTSSGASASAGKMASKFKRVFSRKDSRGAEE